MNELAVVCYAPSRNIVAGWITYVNYSGGIKPSGIPNRKYYLEGCRLVKNKRNSKPTSNPTYTFKDTQLTIYASYANCKR